MCGAQSLEEMSIEFMSEQAKGSDSHAGGLKSQIEFPSGCAQPTDAQDIG